MANHKADSQITLVLEHLKSGKELNPKEALSRYGTFRLGALIFDLRREGYNIISRREDYEKPSGKRGHYAVYRLEEN